MTLDEYLSSKEISVTDFAKQIGAKSRATIYRYMKKNDDERRMPTLEMMRKIIEATNGEVTANDFYVEAAKKKRSKKNA